MRQRLWRWALGLALSSIWATSARAADDAFFFRFAGTTTSVIRAMSPTGTIIWSNAAVAVTGRFQKAAALTGGSNWTDYVECAVTNGMMSLRLFDPHPPSGMVLIPAGIVWMGNCMDPAEGDADELPRHVVCVSAFYMDRYQATPAVWSNVYTWAVAHGYSFSPVVGRAKDPTQPVQDTTWYDAVKWCNARSEQEGRTPAYCTSSALTTVYRTGQVDIANDWVRWDTGYRLPTEAEWEKAARGGATGHRFPWSDTDPIDHGRANYYGQPGDVPYDLGYAGYDTNYRAGGMPYLSPVGNFAPNGYGLYDMAGNVWGRCWDWYSSTYYSSSVGADPRGPASGTYRVVRGGDWQAYHVFECRVANREGFYPNYQGLVGLRAVLPAGQ